MNTIQYTPTTAPNRIVDVEIPETLQIREREFTLPQALRKKNVGFLVNEHGEIIKNCWISPALAHILNSLRQEKPEVAANELVIARAEIGGEISKLIKDKILRDRRGPGIMAFSQANENVPEDSILISKRTWDALCEHNGIWRKAKTLMVVRFPNLGPETTKILKVVVNMEPVRYERQTVSPTSIGSRLPQLADLFKELLKEEEEEETIKDTSAILDCLYLHPSTLKDCFEGDGDGDLIYCLIEEFGRPTFHKTSLVREAGEITDDQIETLFKKANRIDRAQPLDKWLPTYIQGNLIAKATYAIRWEHFKIARSLRRTSFNPNKEAWDRYSGKSIQTIEFVMDIRKGNFTKDEINAKLEEINRISMEIREAQRRGDWFAKTVTSGSIQNVDAFVMTFPTLDTYINYVFNQTP